MKRHSNRTFAWIYEDRITGDHVLVRRPARRSVNGKFWVMQAVYKRQGFRPDKYLGESSRSMDAVEFRSRYKYFGGLNMKGRPSRAV